MTSMVLHQSFVTQWHSSFYIDQLFCHCVFLYFNVHWQLASSLHDGSLHCFCLLAESYETIDQSVASVLPPIIICVSSQWSLFLAGRRGWCIGYRRGGSLPVQTQHHVGRSRRIRKWGYVRCKGLVAKGYNDSKYKELFWFFSVFLKNSCHFFHHSLYENSTSSGCTFVEAWLPCVR